MVCQYVFIIIRDVSKPMWYVADLVQVNGAGQWAGIVKLNKISNPDSLVEITVRVTARPTDYGVDQFLPTPPAKGAKPNNNVQVRRLQ